MTVSRRSRLLAVLGAVFVGLAVILPNVAHADSPPSARIDSVRVSPGHAGFVLTTSNVPGQLDSKTVRVHAGTTALPARVTPVGNTTTTAAPPRAVIIVLDTSGSMAGSGIAAARQAALSYLASLPSDVQAGLLTFSDQPRLAVRPTTNRAAVRTALARVQATGETALYDAVRAAVAALDAARLGASAQRRLVVLSDGVDTSSRAALTSVTGQLAAERIAADVVAFRYGSGDASAAQKIASAAGGRVLAAGNAGELTAAFAAVARNFTARANIELTVPDALAGRNVTLRVTVGSVSTKTAVTFAAVTAPATASPAPPNTAQQAGADRKFWSWQLLALLGGVFLVVLLAVVLLRWQGVREDSARRLVQQISHYGPRREVDQTSETEGAAARTAVGFVGQALRSSGAEQGLARRLDLAAVHRKPAEWALLTACGGAALVAALILLGLSPLLSLPIGLVGSWIVQHVYLSFRIGRRRAAFSEQLPDVLQLIVGSLRSGFSLAQSIDAVVRDGTQPAAGEFSRALAETRIGVDLGDGLNRVADRMDCQDLRWVVMATRIQREVGGNLAEVLKNTVDTMRERAQTRRHVRAISAEGRLSGVIIVSLPIVLGAWLTFSKPQYMSPLFTTSVGLMLIAGGAALIIAGAFWIRALVNVEA
ncbi:tight adherence protein B [Kribbella steppae]|uniref:Tight adherence protein B n=1 Tax=Kribbella steppae TaxID=2512223 RepID=A0A4R2HUG9_9ACTN|nr:VWA domain-containing protein [Kribbella steppae]TCO34238.1 tight adherence protein B [Kribbella steppae]